MGASWFLGKIEEVFDDDEEAGGLFDGRVFGFEEEVSWIFCGRRAVDATALTNGSDCCVERASSEVHHGSDA